ncbi:ABC transporter A family protein [Cavenderia fasciculata]|uniref:ABC transporter A family protein n=1 Tax=Cavenderia fasciculata TaxID=261658 RepID=F4PIS3_CACFS|nr:ABC transporter A family protein [Cavenderia fasciculata]EGG24652.1 ABC transporter A family protein [Cavenderia fasciculata]|eukprot:XP_004362503.1 ABC transporter A family protein [Cavenderia fasciculata]
MMSYFGVTCVLGSVSCFCVQVSSRNMKDLFFKTPSNLFFNNRRTKTSSQFNVVFLEYLYFCITHPYPIIANQPCCVTTTIGISSLRDMSETVTQFKVLARKNLLIKSKSKCGICCEIVFPIILVALLFVLLGIIQAFKPDFDVKPIRPMGQFMGGQRSLLYGPTPLTAEQDAILQIVIGNTAAQFNMQANETAAFFLPFDSVEAMDTHFANNSDSTFAGVWFNSSTPSSPTTPFAYSLRFDSDDLPPNDESYTRNEDGKDYTTTGFLSAQLAFDSAIHQHFGLNFSQSSPVNTQRFTDPFDTNWQRWNTGRDAIYKDAGSVFYTAALFMFAFKIITELVSEKEMKIREGMRMMGMNETAYFTSWIATSLIIALPITILIIIVVKGSAIVYHTGWGSVLLLFIFYLFTLLLLGFIASLFFDSSRFAGLISYGIAIGINIAGIFIAKAEVSKYVKFLLSLLSPIGMACAHYSMAVKDLVDVMNPPPEYTNTDVDEIIGMMILDIVLYGIIYWYLSNVVPGEFGTSKPLLFFLKKSYWFTPDKSKKSFDLENDTFGADQDVELIPMDLRNKVTVSIRGLKKDFNTGNGIRTAVDGLNLEMYQDQIHAFLGHNGAGKSTTIGMLTGLIPCTDGDALVNGYSIQTQMDHVRRTLGVCPQHDIIWKQLTVYEHLCIYAGLKGISGKEIEKQAIFMAKEVGLEEKMHAPSGSLSGGQKRKLCLGIAFIGRSEVIFLDEVTSGMDPLSRRGVWDFLLRNKQSRTIVLTTHFMDEADFLGDRIAIISHGKLRCDGSPLYLKKKFGVGYLLTMSKIEGCQSQSVIDFVHRFIPEAVVLSDAGTELSVRLPTSSVNQFVPLFREMDQQKGYLGIGHYGISITTMEEVFLRIGQESTENGRQFNLNSNENNNEEAVRRAISISSVGVSSKQQLRGLLIKRLQVTFKDIKYFFLSVVLPILVIAGSIALYKGVNTESFFNDVVTPMTYSMTAFGADNIVPIQTVNNNIASLDASPFFAQFNQLPSGESFDDYLIDTYQQAAGALNFSAPIVLSTTDAVPLAYTLYYNRGYLHSSPTHMNLVNDAILRKQTGGTGITLGSMPFRHVRTAFELAMENVNMSAIIYFSIVFMAGYSLMSASFGAQMCVERVSNVKRLLYISGCKKHIYWISSIVWDYSIAILVVIIVSGVLAGIEPKFKEQFGIIFLAQLLYSLSGTPLAYLLSYKFQTSGRAIGGIFGLNIIVGFIFLIASLNVRIQALVNTDETIDLAADIVDYIFFAFSPIYCLGKIMTIILEFPGSLPLGVYMVDNFWTIKLVGIPFIFLAFHTILWTTLIIVVDYIPEIKGKFRNPKDVASPPPPADEDSDVTSERQRLLAPKSDEILQLRDLHRKFPAVGKNPEKLAVYNTTLGIPRGQTFGLLGMNGAGKTSTLSMLSGDIYPTSGSASINGFDLVTERASALKSIGSCPQFDALLPLLNARQQLSLYCRIKGIPEHQIEETVEAFISMMDVTGIANSNVGGYSGGNKRKISLSIAMLGNPSVVFLDEASTGCDPQVRRFMWNVISELGKNKVIIITTHSMEECEALCQRVSIMKDGKLMCLGSNQHIKSKFGSGYSIDIKFKKEYVDTGVDLVRQAIPSISLLDRHDLIANFELPSPNQQVWQLFDIIQQQLSHIVDDYSVSQTSLEQVFLKLTASTYEQRLNQLSESAGPSNMQTPMHS